MVRPHIRLSAGRQGSGGPRYRNSGAARRPRSAIHWLTPAAYASSSARVSGDCAATSPSARRPSPNTRICLSMASVAGPASSDSRPEAARRISSIWNIRSRAWTKPRAVAASRSVAARMRGTPLPSRVISTGADRPAIRSVWLSGGTVSQSTPKARNAASNGSASKGPRNGRRNHHRRRGGSARVVRRVLKRRRARRKTALQATGGRSSRAISGLPFSFGNRFRISGS